MYWELVLTYTETLWRIMNLGRGHKYVKNNYTFGHKKINSNWSPNHIYYIFSLRWLSNKCKWVIILVVIKRPGNTDALTFQLLMLILLWTSPKTWNMDIGRFFPMSLISVDGSPFQLLVHSKNMEVILILTLSSSFPYALTPNAPTPINSNMCIYTYSAYMNMSRCFYDQSILQFQLFFYLHHHLSHGLLQ